MCDSLRKVTFTLGHYEFHPDATSEENAEMNEFSKERNGYFHRWVEDVETSKDIPYVKTMALVEDFESGLVHMVEYTNLKFTED